MATPNPQITIDPAGRIVLPKKIRDRHGIRAGSKLELLEEGNQLILKPLEGKAKIIKKKGLLVFVPEESPSDLDIVEFIKEQREERSKKIAGIS